MSHSSKFRNHSKRIGAIERKAKSGDKEAGKILSVYQNAKDHLSEGKSVRSLSLDSSVNKYLDELHLITAKPVLYVCNVDEKSVLEGNNHVNVLKKSISNEESEILILGAEIEADITELTDFEEKMYLDDLGLDEPGVSKLIKKAIHY